MTANPQPWYAQGNPAGKEGFELGGVGTVSQLLAGLGIILSPVSGRGIVTVAATGTPPLEPSGDNTGATDTANIRAAIVAASALGGTVTLDSGLWYINNLIVVPNKVGLWGQGSGENSAATRIICTTIGAGITFGTRLLGGRAPLSGNFTVDGNNVETQPLSVGAMVEQVFIALESTKSAGIGLVIEGAQNCTFLGFATSHNASIGITFDYSANSNRFFGYEIDSSGTWHVKFQESDANPGPSWNTFHDGIMERVAVTGGVWQAAGESNVIANTQVVHTLATAWQHVRVDVGTLFLLGGFVQSNAGQFGTAYTVALGARLVLGGYPVVNSVNTVMANAGTIVVLGTFLAQAYTTYKTGAGTEIQPLVDGVLFIDATAPKYGLVNDNAATDQTAKLAAAFADTPNGGTCVLPPWKIGITNLAAPPTIHVRGSGCTWLRDNLGVFATVANVVLTNYGGTVLVSTAAAGVAFSQIPTATQKGSAKGFAVVGPGSGAAIGVDLGSVAFSLVESDYDIGVFNFPTGVRLRNVEDSKLSFTAIGCTTPCVIGAGTNNNVWNMLDLEKNTTPGSTDPAALGNLFLSPIFQSNVAVGFTLDGADNVMNTPWLESNGTAGIDVKGARNAVTRPHIGTATDLVRIIAGATNTYYDGPTAAATLTDNGTDTITTQVRPWIAVLGGVGFQNGWVNTGNPAKFRKTPDGQHVEFMGAITGGASGTVAFTLPVGFHPAVGNSLPFADDSNGTILYAAVTSAGNVMLFNSAAGNEQNLRPMLVAL